MISYFPEFYPEELFYSTCARYQKQTLIKQKGVIEKLFNVRTSCAVMDYPSRINFFVKNSGEVLSANNIILNHTLLPYYHHFISREVLKKIYRYMLSSDMGHRIHSTLGVNSSTVIKPKYFRYCKICFSDEIVYYGEAYWHRCHQLPGVYFCPKHQIQLSKTNEPLSSIRGKHRFITPTDIVNINDLEEDIPYNLKDKLKKLSIFTLDLLQQNVISPNNKNVLDKYHDILNQKGYKTATGRVRFKYLIEDFNEFHGSELLEFLNCYVIEGSEDTWFHKVFRNSNNNCHPLRHLLIMQFLNIDLKALSIIKNNEPFGLGPWPCLNPVVSHFKEPVIKHCIITRGSKTKKPTGHFTCDCGFSYIRTGPDNSDRDRFRIGRIQSYGEVWLRKAKELANNQDLSVRERARVLGVDSKTFIKYSTQDYQDKKNTLDELVLIQRRRGILHSLQHLATLTKRNIQTVNPQDYNWLLKNDKDWFKGWLDIITSPSERPKNPIKIDWMTRDIEMHTLVKVAINSIINEPKPVRITKASLIKATGYQTCLTYSLHKLPKTNLLMANHIESLEDFQKRRIDWAINSLMLIGELKAWRVRRLASITEKCSLTVKTYLEEEISLKKTL